MKKNLDITLRPEKITFTGNCIKIADFHTRKYKISYKEIVLAYLRVFNQESGMSYEPEIVDITSNMEGELVIYNSARCQYRIKTDLTGKPAGALLLELSMHAPYILIGAQDWFDRGNDEEFEEIINMVKIMGQC